MEFFCFALPPAWKDAILPAVLTPGNRWSFPSRCPGELALAGTARLG